MTEKEGKILDMIAERGDVEGIHYKQGLLDDIVRVLTGNEYAKWVRNWEAGYDGTENCKWDVGL